MRRYALIALAIVLIGLTSVAFMPSPLQGLVATQTAGASQGAVTGPVPSVARKISMTLLYSTNDLPAARYEYVAAGMGLRDTGYGSINLRLPLSTTLVKALLFWDVLDATAAAAGTHSANLIVLDGVRVSGTKIASGASPCWGPTGEVNVAYYADVTTIIGNSATGTEWLGNTISGAASGLTNGEDPWTTTFTNPAMEGASLVFIYSVPGVTPTTNVNIYGSAVEYSGGSVSFSATFPAHAATNAFVTPIIADGQKQGISQIPGQAFMMGVITLQNVTLNGADPSMQSLAQRKGSLWDSPTFDITAALATGATTATFTISAQSDCQVWTGLAIQT